MTKTFNYNDKGLEESYKKIKKVIQHPHLYKSVKKSTVRAASAWASAKWGKNIDYHIILATLGVLEIED